MKIALAAAAVALLAAQAHADVIIPGSFSGTVDDGSYTDSGPVNTSYVVGQAISGTFAYDATTDAFTAFQIGGYTVQPGYTSIHSPALSSTPYAYLGVQNQVPNAAPSNSLQINLYYENAPFPQTANFKNFLLYGPAFSQDLTGGSPSYFAAYLTNPNGSVTQVDALLTSFSAPEPAALAVALAGLAGIALVRRRR